MSDWTCINRECREFNMHYEAMPGAIGAPECNGCGYALQPVKSPVHNAIMADVEKENDLREADQQAKEDGTDWYAKKEIEQDQKAEEAKMQEEVIDLSAEFSQTRSSTTKIIKKSTRATRNMRNLEKKLLEDLRELLRTDREWIYIGVQLVAKQQTNSEYSAEVSDVDNGVGFTKADAEILTSFAKQLERKNGLSPKQDYILFKLMPKYAAQILRLTKHMRGGN